MTKCKYLLIMCLASQAIAADITIDPVKVFILAGQSNMEGKAQNKLFDYQATGPKTKDFFAHLRDGDKWAVRDDVFIKFLNRKGPLTIGYGSPGRTGSELEFGYMMGQYFDEPVILIKAAWGGHSLFKLFRSPSAGMPSDEKLQAELEQAQKRVKQNNEKRNRSDPLPTIEDIKEPYGSSYRNMMAEVKDVFDNYETMFPSLKGKKLELAGFVWFQGFNDQWGYAPGEYESNMKHLIKDVRKDLNAPKLPFVIAAIGTSGSKPARGGQLEVRNAQMAMNDVSEFKGNVKTFRTDLLVDKDAERLFDGWQNHIEEWQKVGSDRPYHYLGSAIWYTRIGHAMGESMLELMKAKEEQVIWLESEQFDDTGGWSNDPQHVDLMGSPYLLATGIGKPVEDAVARTQIAQAGSYRLWVRCRDWLPDYSPGQFQILVGGKPSPVTFGKSRSDAWQWIDGGTFSLQSGKTEIRLHDLTGWWGRCDVVVFAPEEFRPSDSLKELEQQRVKHCGVTPDIKAMGPYDVMVVGGGPAGIGAALAAARNECRIALVQDRPVLGGNSSSEISVPPMGYIGNPPDLANVSGIAEEIFPKQGWLNFADSKKIERIVRAEKNILLFLNTRATGVEMIDKNRIKSVLALNVHTGQRMSFTSPRFIDCTGHGWIGYYAGAEYRMGQEARAEFGETLAPVEAGNQTMGNCLYKAVFQDHKQNSSDGIPFECPDWVYQWKKDSDFEGRGTHRRTSMIIRPENFDVPSRGKGRNPGDDINGAISLAWWIEYGGILNTIEDAEKIRDELFRISIGLWNYAKNHNTNTIAKNKYRELVWLNYVPGVRESRRLVGDYMMSQKDYDKQVVHPDTIAFTDWGPDVHHPEGFWVRGNDCIHVYQGRRTSIPYRTLYSRNIENLFMAGRCHSATHIALGGTRVMRPMCATGQAAGTAAAIAHKHGTTPRGVYESHIEELQQTLLKDGCYLMGVKNADRNDLSLGGTAMASSETPGAGAGNVNNGWNRVAGKDRNAWAPDPKSSGPQWVQIQLARATVVDTVHVTFESECETSQVQVLENDTWRTVANIEANPARRTVLRFSPVKIDQLRLLFDKPSQQTAVCEMRIYLTQENPN